MCDNDEDEDEDGSGYDSIELLQRDVLDGVLSVAARHGARAVDQVRQRHEFACGRQDRAWWRQRREWSITRWCVELGVPFPARNPAIRATILGAHRENRGRKGRKRG